MKISDPIIFWCYRRISFAAALFEKYSTLFTELNIDTRNGLGDVCKIAGHPQQLK
jgi:isocitrate dehydrogenase